MSDCNGDALTPPATQETFSREQIVSTIERVADWQLDHPATEARLPDGGSQPVNDTGWIRGAFFAGVMAAFRATGNRRYFEAARAIGDTNGWQPGPRPRHADDWCIAQTYVELYLEAGDRRMIQPTIGRLDCMIAEPRPASVVGWREDDNWAWCDALFMAPPPMALVAEATGDWRYLHLMNTMWWESFDHLYDPEERLWYRDGRYRLQPDGSQPRTLGGQKVFWGRGNGWVLAGLARVLAHMPPDHPERPRYERLLRDMAGRLVELQGEDGLWRASLLDPDEYPAPETSGSGFIAFGLAWGINNDVLDREQFLPPVQEAWMGLNWAVDPSGRLGWVQPCGYDPRPVSESDSMEYGAGALLLAASEIVKLV